MRPTERLKLISSIAVELQKRFTFRQLDIFLRASGVEPWLLHDDYQSKAVYAEATLAHASDDKLLAISVDLGHDMLTTSILPSGPFAASPDLAPILPKNWEGTTDFRLFISHVSKAKDRATRLKGALARHCISAFVAHEDIYPTEPWQVEIERALRTMDAFLAVHTAGFKDSIWTNQEIGFAVGRGVKVLSFKMDEDPPGFIAKDQAIPWRGRKAEEIADEIEGLLHKDKRTAERLADAQDTVPF